MPRDPIMKSFARFRRLSGDLLESSARLDGDASKPRFRFRFLRRTKRGGPDLTDLYEIATLSHVSSGIRRSNPALTIDKRAILYGKWFDANPYSILLLERLAPGETAFKTVANSIQLPLTAKSFQRIADRELAVIQLQTQDICGAGDEFDVLLMDTWVIDRNCRDFPGTQQQHFGYGNALPLKHLGVFWDCNRKISIYVEPDAKVMGKLLQRLSFEELGRTKIGLDLFRVTYPASPPAENTVSSLMLKEAVNSIREYAQWPPALTNTHESHDQETKQQSTTNSKSNSHERPAGPREYEEAQNAMEGFRLLGYFTGPIQERLGEKPFAGLQVVFVLHFLRDLKAFTLSCEELGLSPKHTTLFYKDEYPYPRKDEVAKWLTNRGYAVKPVSKIQEYFAGLAEGITDNSPRLLIVEDGGFIAPLLHRTNSRLLAHTVGAVEQTTRGIWNLESWLQEGTTNTPGFPVLSIPDSTIKRSVEPPLIAESVLLSIRSLVEISIPGLRAAVLGLGAIGGRVARGLRSAGANVVGYDSGNVHGVMSLLLDGCELANTANQAVRGRRLVIGCSGKTSITGPVIENLVSGVHLVSASSERIEVDHRYLRNRDRTPQPFYGPHGDYPAGHRYQLDQRQINLVADGYPVTFWHAPGMSDEGGDLVMAVILIAAAELAARNGRSVSNNPYPNGILRREVDDLDKAYQILQMHLQLYYPEQLMGGG